MLLISVDDSFRSALLEHFRAGPSRSDREEIDKRFDSISSAFARIAAEGLGLAAWLIDTARRLRDATRGVRQYAVANS